MEGITIAAFSNSRASRMRNRLTLVTSICVLLLSMSVSKPYSRTWLVRQDGTGDATRIDEVLWWYAQPGDTVLVGPGTYRQGLMELGAIHLISEAGPQATIIQLQISDIEWDVHVIVIGFVSNCSVIGFTIRGARNGWLSNGGGIDIIESSAMIMDNIITDNWCAAGGGIACYGSPAPTIEGNLIYGNGAIAGAAMMIQRCSPTIRNNTIVDNHANGAAGALYIIGEQSFPVISNNVIVSNSGTDFGAIYGDTPANQISLSCNDVWGNQPCNYDYPLIDQTGLNGNISENPLFCGVASSRNYYLQAGSPCAVGNVPPFCAGSIMGCYSVKCTVGVRESSWGSMKSLFKEGKK